MYRPSALRPLISDTMYIMLRLQTTFSLAVDSRSWYSEPNKNSSYSTSLSCWFEKFQVEIRIDLTKPSYRFEVTTDSIYTSLKGMSHR